MVLPFRDAQSTLGEALRSIRTQTVRAWECVLVDNESRDASSAIAARACERDQRFRLIARQGGLVDALNAGVAAARAPFVARMDADDVSHPRRFEDQIALLRADPSLSIVSCLVSTFAAVAVREGMQRYVAWLNSVRTPSEIRNALFVESPLAHPSVVMRREAVHAVGVYSAGDGPEDYDLWMRLLLGGHRAAKVPKVLLRWRDSGQRLTRSDPRYHAQRFFDTKLRYFDRVVTPGSCIQIWGAGPIGRSWARALSRAGYPIRRFIDIDPRKYGREHCGARVEPPAALKRGGGFVVAAVGRPGARALIERHLQLRGFRPWDDYLSVA